MIRRIAAACFYIFIPFIYCIEAEAKSPSSEKPRPQWLHKLPKPSNPSFTYETTSATAESLDIAREKCLAELIIGSGLQNGIVAISTNNSSEKLSQVWQNGKLSEHVSYDSHTSTQTHYDAVKLHVKNIAEYWTINEEGYYFLTKLYARSTMETTPVFDDTELTTRYGARGLWRSAIIPGWGQFYKGAHLKGGLILGGCAVFAGGAVFMENQRADYVRKISRTHNNELINKYATKQDHFAAARNICIGTAVAIYIYNLIDAIAAPGARRIITSKKRHIDYSLFPTMTQEGSPCIMGSMKF